MTVREIETPHGPARAHLYAAHDPRAALVLGHGAGGGVEAPDLGAAREAARSERITVTLVEQPYRVAGRRSPAGAAQLDAERPERLLSRSSEWLFGPQAPYERGDGDVSDVVFPCGWLLAEDGDTLRVYYGAADSSVCVATASLSELLDWLARHSS